MNSPTLPVYKIKVRQTLNIKFVTFYKAILINTLYFQTLQSDYLTERTLQFTKERVDRSIGIKARILMAYLFAEVLYNPNDKIWRSRDDAVRRLALGLMTF